MLVRSWGRKQSLGVVVFLIGISVWSCGPQRIPQLWNHGKIRGPLDYRRAVCLAIARGLPAFPLQTPGPWFIVQSQKHGAALMNLEQAVICYPFSPQKIEKKKCLVLNYESNKEVARCWLDGTLHSYSPATTLFLNGCRGDVCKCCWLCWNESICFMLTCLKWLVEAVPKQTLNKRVWKFS